MIALTYGNIRNPIFLPALDKLVAFKDFKSIKVIYNIGKIGKAVSDEYKTCQEMLNEFSKKYGLKNDDGTVYLNAKNEWTPQPDLMAEFEEQVKELLAIEFKVDRAPIKLCDIDGVDLSPIDLIALEPLLEKDTELV